MLKKKEDAERKKNKTIHALGVQLPFLASDTEIDLGVDVRENSWEMAKETLGGRWIKQEVVGL